MVFAKLAQRLEQLAFLRAVTPLRPDSIHERTLVPSRGWALHRLQSTQQLGFWTSSVLDSSELNSFLLIMCIDASESTTNSRSSGLFEVGAGI